MKTIFLLRHGKADPNRTQAGDEARALTKRGQADAQAIGAYLDQITDEIDCVLCSSAVRTRQTLDALNAGVLRTADVHFDQSLYLAPYPVLVRSLQALNENYASVLVIGHNPGLHELGCALIKPSLTAAANAIAVHFPTCALAHIEAACETWFEVSAGCGDLAHFITPSALRSSL